jgi:hypothetical protein
MSGSTRRLRRASWFALAAPFLFAVSGHTSGQTQTLYKCEEDGKVTYRDAVCAAGKLLPPPKQPAPADVAAAEIQAFRNKTELERLEEKSARPAPQQVRSRRGSLRQASDRQSQCRKLALDLKWKTEDALGTTSTLSTPSTSSTQLSTPARARAADKSARSAQRLAEKYQALCAQPAQMTMASGADLPDPTSISPTAPRQAARRRRNTSRDE